MPFPIESLSFVYLPSASFSQSLSWVKGMGRYRCVWLDCFRFWGFWYCLTVFRPIKLINPNISHTNLLPQRYCSHLGTTIRLNGIHKATPTLHSVCFPSIYLIFKERYCLTVFGFVDVPW